MKSLYSKYIKEREGKEIIESGIGFMTYKIKGDECYVADVYIEPEFRKSGIASEMCSKIEKIARERGCKFLTGTVTPSLEGANVSLISQLNYGFKLHSCINDFIILKKDL